MRRWLILFTLLSFAGCTPEAKLKPADNDFETPAFLRAKEKFELRDYEGAIGLYEDVVRSNPNMAKAHLELGLIYDDKMGDYVSAIHHYRRFLKLRPDSDKARIVKQWITRAELAFAAQQPNSPLQNADELARLQKENINLKAQVEEARRVQRELQAQLKAALAQPIVTAPVERPAPIEERPKPEVTRHVPKEPAKQPAPQAQPPVARETAAAPSQQPPQRPIPVAVPVAPPAVAAPSPAAAPTQPAPAPAPTARVHVVQEGDTLWRIASRYYPGEVQRGVERIQEANKGAVADVTKLRVGQQLRVP